MRTRNQDKSTPTSTPADQARRPNRKRRASSASDAPAPQESSSSQVASQQQVKRRKRHTSSDHPEELRVVDEEDIVTVSTPAASSRHVRFTESVSAQGNRDTSAHLTPHVRKSTADRRQTLTNSAFEKLSTPKGKNRLSLPASFALSPDSPAAKSFRPLSQVIQERVKNRLRRSRLTEEIKEQRDAVETHQELMQLRGEISELEDVIRQRLHQLDVQKQLGEDADDQKMAAIEVELAELNEDLNDKKEQEAALPDLDAHDHVDVANEDMMVFDSTQDISYPQLPSTNGEVRLVKRSPDSVEINNAATQVAFPDYNHEEERRSFENAIKHWTREAADAKAALEILTIELQSLGFGGEGASTESILFSIRDSFASVRERLESAVPGQIPSDITNSDLVDLVSDHLEALALKVAEQEAYLEDNAKLREELIHEIDELLERLSQAEIRKRTLEIGFNELDAQSQKDEALIDQLDKQLKKIESNHDMAQALITEKQAKLTNLDRENQDLEATVNKLGAALEGYRLSESNLQVLISRLEVEHKAMVQELEQSNQETVADLQEKLETEITKRALAENDANDKQLTITTLEERAAMDETNLDSLKQQLVALEEERATEQDLKEAAEMDRNSKALVITELEVKIEQAETDLEELRIELDSLRDLHEAEQRQREAAETDLDKRIATIDDLEQKLSVSGTEANKLREKIWEAQQREKKNIQELQDVALARENQFQTDMAAEVARREESEENAAHRNVVIGQLTEALRDLEDAMKVQLMERDEKITELAARADQLQAELDQTQKELDTALNDLDTLQETSEAQISQLTTDIVALQATLIEREATIVTLTNQAVTTEQTHASAISDRDERIADLNHDIFTARAQLQVLETEKASLERRVESEAEAMLELQADKDDAISSLKDTIRIKQAEIEDLGRKAQEVDRSWARVMEQRDEEITELRTSGDNNTLVIARLTKINATLKDKFRKYVRDSTATAQAMKDELEQALLGAATKNGDLREEGRRVLEDVEALDEVGEMQGFASSSASAVNPRVKAMKSTRRSTRRQYDSGIGVDEESMLLED